MGDRMTDPFEPYQNETEYDWDYDDEPRQQPKILWGRVVALGAVLLLAFFLGRSTAPSGVDESEVNALRADLADAREEITELEDDLATQPQNPGLPSPTPTEEEDGPTGTVRQNYVVKSGDTWVGIAEQLYGDTSYADCIADANGLSTDSTLRTGTELVVLEKADCD